MKEKFYKNLMLMLRANNILAFVGGLVYFFVTFNVSGLVISYLSIVSYISLSILATVVTFFNSFLQVETVNGETLGNIADMTVWLVNQPTQPPTAELKEANELIRRLNNMN